MTIKIHSRIAISEGLDETVHSEQSDLRLHSLPSYFQPALTKLYHKKFDY